MAKTILSEQVVLKISSAGTVTLVEHCYEIESSDAPGEAIATPTAHTSDATLKMAIEAAATTLIGDAAMTTFKAATLAAAKTNEGI